MKEFIEKLIGRLEEEAVEIYREPTVNDEPCSGLIPTGDKDILLSKAKKIVNQLAEEYGEDTNVRTGVLHELKKFLKEKIDYCAEQAEDYLEAECNSEIASYFRERKELYLERANIYGEVMRVIDRLAEEYNNKSVKTNADYIRNMTNDELTTFLSSIDHITDEGDRLVLFEGEAMHDNIVDIEIWLKEEREPKGE